MVVHCDCPSTQNPRLASREETTLVVGNIGMMRRSADYLRLYTIIPTDRLLAHVVSSRSDEVAGRTQNILGGTNRSTHQFVPDVCSYDGLPDHVRTQTNCLHVNDPTGQPVLQAFGCHRPTLRCRCGPLGSSMTDPTVHARCAPVVDIDRLVASTNGPCSVGFCHGESRRETSGIGIDGTHRMAYSAPTRS